MRFEFGIVNTARAEKDITVSSERRCGRGNRPGKCRRDTAVNDAVVANIFIAELKPHGIADARGNRGIDAEMFAVIGIAVIGECFVKPVQTQRGAVAEADIAVNRTIPAAEAVDRTRDIGLVLANERAFGDTIDDTAAAAATEHHGIGAFVHFNAVDIIKTAEILNVVAQAVDEEIGCGVIAAQRDLVAVPLALARRYAGQQADEIGNRPDRLIADLLIGDDVDCLRHVEDRRARFGAARRIDCAVTVNLAGNDNGLSVYLWLVGMRDTGIGQG